MIQLTAHISHIDPSRKNLETHTTARKDHTDCQRLHLAEQITGKEKAGRICKETHLAKMLPRTLRDTEAPASAGDRGSTPGLGRPPGEGNGNPLQYSCLENPLDRGAWWTAVHEAHKRIRHHLVTK